jgi:hypothetical protein
MARREIAGSNPQTTSGSEAHTAYLIGIGELTTHAAAHTSHSKERENG